MKCDFVNVRFDTQAGGSHQLAPTISGMIGIHRKVCFALNFVSFACSSYYSPSYCQLFYLRSRANCLQLLSAALVAVCIPHNATKYEH